MGAAGPPDEQDFGLLPGPRRRSDTAAGADGGRQRYCRHAGLGTINMGATAAAHGGPVGQLLAALLIAQVVHTLSQRYVFGVAFGEAERAMDAYRVKQVERVRRCHLDSLEAIGPALIHGA